MGGRKLALAGAVLTTMALASWVQPAADSRAAAQDAEPMALPGEELEASSPGAFRETIAPEALRDDSGAAFSIQVRDLVVRYRVMGLFVHPGETVEFKILSGDGLSYDLVFGAGHLDSENTNEWTWTAPERPGWYPLTVHAPGDTMLFNTFVMTPFQNGEPVLNQYRIGEYRSKPLRGNQRYQAPEGFIEVTDETAPIRISPNFTLGDFASHQAGQPRYMALDERLLIKLEMLLEELREDGFDISTFTVMSGFRTPWYNASIGNKTSYSMHLYGRAADIFVDEDGNGRMDDLNGNGREDAGDARILYDFVHGISGQSWYEPFLGGLGLYGPKPHRGPFVHVDVRGSVARW